MAINTLYMTGILRKDLFHTFLNMQYGCVRISMTNKQIVR